MEIRKSLEVNFLTCKHCQQTYRRPKVLVCLHTFCQACLEEVLSKQEKEKDFKEAEASKRYYAISNPATEYKSKYHKKWSSKFRYGDYDSTNYASSLHPHLSTKPRSIICPRCEKETVLPPGGVNNLPTDQLADRLASMVDRMPTYPVCDVCTKQPLLTEPVDSSSTSDKILPGSKTEAQSQFVPSNRRKSKEQISSRDMDDSECEDNESNMHCIVSNESIKSEHGSRKRYTSSDSGYRKSRRRTVENSASNVNVQDPRPAIAACLDCAKRLCSICCETHSKMPVTLNHVLIRLDQMEELQCSRHPRELRRFYCLTCREYVCIVCTFENSINEAPESDDAHANKGHADHDILSIREAVTAYQNQLSRESATTQLHVNEIESLLSSLQICEVEMKKLYAAIDANTKAFIEQLQRQQLYLRDRVDKQAGVPLKILSSECNRLVRSTNKWYEFLNDGHVSSRLDLLDPLEALHQAGIMLDKVQQCLEAISPPLDNNLTRQPFLMQLKAAEGSLLNGDSGVVSSQSLSPPSNEEAIEFSDDARTTYWRSRLGKFEPGKLEFGRIVTTKELEAEAKAKAAKWVSTLVQTGPELVRALPPPKGAQRHRAIQINLLEANLEDRASQTEPVTIGSSKPFRVDKGTQYLSSDVNPPISMYRSIKQILVQK